MSRTSQSQVIKVDNTEKKQKAQGSLLGNLFKMASPFLDPMTATLGNAAFGALHSVGRGDAGGLSDAASEIAQGLLVPESPSSVIPPPGDGKLEPIPSMSGDGDGSDQETAQEDEQEQDPQLTAFLQTNPQLQEVFAGNPDMLNVVRAVLNYGQA